MALQALNELRKVARRARLAVKHFGVCGTLRQVPEYLRRFVDASEVDAQIYAAEQRERYDERHGIETVGHVDVFELEGVGPNEIANNSPYSPTPLATARSLLAALLIDPARFTFVDFGCGKGRMMFLASDYPYQRIVGVDFSSELIAIARANVARFRSDTQRCRTFELHCQDATLFPLPKENSVFFFYQPFSLRVARRVFSNIGRSLSEHPREAWVISVGHNYDEIFPEFPFFTRMEHRPSPDGTYFDATLLKAGTAAA